MGLWPTQGDEKLMGAPFKPSVGLSGQHACPGLPWGCPGTCFSTERTRISYFALLATTTCAALRRESRIWSFYIFVRNTMFSTVTTFGFVSGHDFSRAALNLNRFGL